MHLFGIDPNQLNEEEGDGDGEGEYPEEIAEENDDQDGWLIQFSFNLPFYYLCSQWILHEYLQIADDSLIKWTPLGILQVWNPFPTNVLPLINTTITCGDITTYIKQLITTQKEQ